jgi:hypothetical protein
MRIEGIYEGKPSIKSPRRSCGVLSGFEALDVGFETTQLLVL